MPRIYDAKGIAMDYCRRDFPERIEAEEVFDDQALEVSLFEYNARHPDYDLSDIGCAACGQALTGEDE